jgi:hypothetical protein
MRQSTIRAEIGASRTAFRFVLLIGILSFFADFTYVGSRSILGSWPRLRASLRVGTPRFRNGDRRDCRARQRQSSPALAASRATPLSVFADRARAMRDQ